MHAAGEYDVVVVGAGPGGEAAAAHVARAGGRVALIERELVGGECPYWGCMPSKALLRPGQVLAETSRTPGVVLATGRLDAGAVLERRDEVVRNLSDDSHVRRLERAGVEIVRGHGRLSGERQVDVDLADGTSRTLTASHAVMLAPGTHAVVPPIDGIAEARIWTNREATLATEVPRRLAIIGGGVIGVELAQAWRSLGSDVALLEGADTLLAREEPEAAALVETALREAGIEVRCGALVTRVERDADGLVQVQLDGGSGGAVTADELLVAVGRRANTADLGLDVLGIEPGRGGYVEVDSCMRHPDHRWLFVVGDANGRAQFTHTAVYGAKVAARTALGLDIHSVEDRVAAPRVVFTDPSVAAVGHTLASATEAGLRVRAFDRDPQRTAAGSFHGRGTTGLARLILDLDTRLIVGATFVGSELAELLHSATIAIVGEVPLERLRHCVAPFPTRSEVWTRLIELVDRELEPLLVDPPPSPAST